MRAAVVLSIVIAAFGATEEEAPVGIVRGKLLEVRTSVQPATFTLQAQPDRTYACHYDAHTYIEREGQRVTMAALRAGDPLEVIADRKLGAGLCYARTIRFVEFRPTAANPGYRLYPRGTRLVTESFAPRGSLTFAGVILRFNPEMIVLRARNGGGEKRLLLRGDTRFVENGFPAELSHLAPNTRVFIRAGRSFDNELEVYQIVWGELPGPRR